VQMLGARGAAGAEALSKSTAAKSPPKKPVK
jgi:hypothetical protein